VTDDDIAYLRTVMPHCEEGFWAWMANELDARNLKACRRVECEPPAPGLDRAPRVAPGEAEDVVVVVRQESSTPDVCFAFTRQVLEGYMSVVEGQCS
jgi:hypothetical protein